ncbi:hypothetical protein CLOM_g6358 [Closterium sp. NIES-68]|nr:hypothetical protein CLOM_g6358 [Closterium sp. NIES-68]GJP64734.1 hypothetical protein CLOP_g21688 [Closterium sp. NIES-67]
MFGVLFPNRSFPLDVSRFKQVDTFHWVLEMNMFVGDAYDQVKEICIFLLTEAALPPDRALAVYVQSPGSQFEYRGAVHVGCPSAVLPLLWPAAAIPTGAVLPPGGVPPTAQIGISVEPLASLPLQNVGWQKRVEEMALKVGQNLFNYMQSFSTVQGSMLLVPSDILDRWFKKFQDKAKVDPDFLNRFNV